MSSEDPSSSIGYWSRMAVAIYWPTLAVCTHWPRLDIGTNTSLLPELMPDKLLHFGAFLVLATLLVYARFLPRCGFLLNLIAGTAVAVSYAFLDEFTQGWFDRSISVADMVGNLIGVATAFLILSYGQTAIRIGHGKVWFYRGLLVLAIPLIALTVFDQDLWVRLPSGIRQYAMSHIEAVRLLVAVLSTWLLSAARLGGRTRPGLNVIAVVATIAALGLVFANTGGTFEHQPQLNETFWHELGLLIGLAAWSLMALGNYLCKPPGAVIVWPPVLHHRSEADADVQGLHLGHETMQTRFVGHAMLISVLTVGSRVTGLVRGAVLAAVFGMGSTVDAFFLAFLIPNLFRRLFGEGALSAAFIPVYTQLMRQDRLAAQRLASLCIALMLVVLGGMTVIGEVALSWLAVTEGLSQDGELAVQLTMVMLPYMPMICLVAALGGMLQVHGRFGPHAAAPIVLNLTLIGGVCLVTSGTGVGGDPFLRNHIPLVAAFVLVAGVVQLMWQVFAVLEVERFTLQLAGAGAAMRDVLRSMAPMLIGLAIFQINALLDLLIAWCLSPKQGGSNLLRLFGSEVRFPIQSGSVAALQWSQRLYQFPLAVSGIAIATAIFPSLSRVSSAQDENEQRHFVAILRQALRLTMVVSLPASVGLILVRLPLVRLIFERGQFHLEDAHRVATILAGYGSAVWAYSMTHVITRAFYARKDARTPMKVGIAVVGLNLVMNLILVWFLGAAGLAWSTAICALVQITWLLKAMRQHVDRPVDIGVWRSWARSAFVTVIMAAALLPIVIILDPAGLTPIGSALILGLMVIVGMVMFLVVGWLSGVSELRWLWQQMAGRHGRWGI